MTKTEFTHTSRWRQAAFLLALFLQIGWAQAPLASWKGTLRDAAGQPVSGARVVLHGAAKDLDARTAADGAFEFREVPAGKYAVKVQWSGGSGSVAGAVEFAAGAQMQQSLRVTAAGGVLLQADSQSTGGEQLSGKQVSALPLNKRDFSQLLLQAAGTQTDTNGAANFTQQFTVNGQRGTATVFAMDGVDTTDPEMGGATFSNFNVDAIQEINSSSGVMPADIGHGAAGFTAITTKSGANDLHGSLFEDAIGPSTLPNTRASARCSGPRKFCPCPPPMSAAALIPRPSPATRSSSR